MKSIKDIKMGRKFCVGGNWKMNGSKDSITELCKILSAGPLDPNVEVSERLQIADYVINQEIIDFFIFSQNCSQVVVGCPSVFISFARGLLPASIGVAGQVNEEYLISSKTSSKTKEHFSRMPLKSNQEHSLVKFLQQC